MINVRMRTRARNHSCWPALGILRESYYCLSHWSNSNLEMRPNELTRRDGPSRRSACFECGHALPNPSHAEVIEHVVHRYDRDVLQLRLSGQHAIKRIPVGTG